MTDNNLGRIDVKPVFVRFPQTERGFRMRDALEVAAEHDGRSLSNFLLHYGLMAAEKLAGKDGE